MGNILCGTEVDEVEYVDCHVLQTLVSILVEISGYFIHYQVEVPLGSLFEAVLGLAHILFLASSANYVVDHGAIP